jgi:choline dehydrogenase-like flavoprotein
MEDGRAVGVEVLPRAGSGTADPGPCRTWRDAVRLGADRHAAAACSCSGIGPAASADASTRSRSPRELPGVGENLQDHLQLRAAFERAARPDAQRPWTHSPLGKAARSGLENLFRRTAGR